MRKPIPLKFLLLADFLLACGMAAWEHVRSADPMSALAVFLSVLIAASPLAYLAGSCFVLAFARSLAKKYGIRLRKPGALETLCFVDTLAVGKSGTITDGEPTITDLVPEGMMQSTLLSLAASAEQGSSHPIGRAICQAALDRSLRIQQASAFNEVPGCGIETILAGSSLRVGRPKWLQSEGVKISASLLTKIDQLACKGKIPVVLSEGNNARGIIAVEDSVNEATATAVRRLAKEGVSTVMLTSDSQRTAAAIGKAASLAGTRANLTPEGKAREIQLMRTRGSTIAMAGHPSQDALAFQEADLSIVLGKAPKDAFGKPRKINLMDIKDEDEPSRAGGEDAKDAEDEQLAAEMAKADMALPKGLPQLLDALELARQAHGIVRQNRRIAALAWLLLLPPAMGLLAAFDGPLLPPLYAFAGILAASLLILLNSLRIWAVQKKTQL